MRPHFDPSIMLNRKQGQLRNTITCRTIDCRQLILMLAAMLGTPPAFIANSR